MINKRTDLPIEELNQLLEPGYMPIETGCCRLTNGDIHVRVLIRMPRCKGKMVDWWFGYVRDTETYKMWHPAHRFLEWDEKRSPGHYIGATHTIEEQVGTKIFKVRIRFYDPKEVFDVSRFKAARWGAAVCGDAIDEKGIPHGYLIHTVRDTDYGCEMRNRFWLLHNPDDKVGLGVMTHNLEEMGNLSDFLPDLYARENPSRKSEKLFVRQKQ